MICTRSSRACCATAPGSLALALLAAGCSHGGAPTSTLAFAEPQLLALGSNATGLTLSDVDGDGFANRTLLLKDQGQLCILRSDHTQILVPIGAASGVLAWGDLDGDHWQDAVTASQSLGLLTVTRSDGHGGWRPGQTSPIVNGARGLLVGDFTGDGRADVVVAHTAEPRLSVLVGDGAGGFTSSRGIELSAEPGDLAAADFDRDGRLDVAVVVGGQVITLLQTPGGTFAPPRLCPVSGAMGQLAAADLDRDEDMDIVALARSGTMAVPAIADGTGTCTAVDPVALPSASSGLLLCDLDLDGRADLVIASGNQVLAAYGTAGGFSPFESLAASAGLVSSLAAADLDLDGFQDLAWLVGNTTLAMMRNPKVRPAGLVSYGTGTPGCRGRCVLTGNGRPRIGNADFQLVATSAPASTFGLLLLGGPADEPGSDPFGLGCRLHVGPAMLISSLWFSDCTGTAYHRQPVPANQDLLGTEVLAQVLWQERAGGCSPSPLGVVSSTGLRVTLQR